MPLREFPSSPTLKIYQLASEKKAKGERVYNFSAGDPALPNHPAIIESAKKGLERGKAPYPPIEGLEELREAFASWQNRSYGTGYTSGDVAVTCGGKFALYSILASFLDPGDTLLLVAPYWVSYPGMASVLGLEAKNIATSPEEGWKLTPELLEKHFTRSAKCLILNNACNPTGVLYTKPELQALLSTAVRLGLKIISDEVYSGLVWDPLTPFTSCGAFPEFREHVFVIQSCSKNFAMSGWRVGFIGADPKRLARIKAFQQQTTSGVSLVSQWGALGALTHADEVLGYVRGGLEKRLKLFQQTFNTLFKTELKIPQSAIYFFLPLSFLRLDFCQGAEGAAEELIKRGNIAAVPGEAFGMPGYLRFACSEGEEEISQGVHQLYNMSIK